jgi:hypothetical protein
MRLIMGTFEEIIDKSDINEIMSRTEFLKKIQDSGIDLTDIDPETRLPNDILKIISKKRACNEQFYILNILLKKLHLCGDINIVESAVYLYKEFFDMKTIVKCLNEENLYLIRQELLKRYKLKSNKVNSSLKLYFS